MTPDYAEIRHQKALRFLDTHFPGWWEKGRVDLSLLDMSHPDHCILGQLYNRQRGGPRVDIITRHEPGDDGSIYAGLATDDWRWKDEILRRRARVSQ